MKNIFLIGPMGAGKTSIGRALAEELRMDFYDSDQVIETRAGTDLLWIYDIEGEEGFRVREKKVIAELVKIPNIVLSTGGNTVAVPENRAALAANGIVVYLRTTLDNQMRRTDYSKKRPLASEPKERRGELENLRSEFLPLYEELADIIYDTDGHSTKFVVRELIKKLSTP